MTVPSSYVVSVKAQKAGEDDPTYTRFEVQTSGGPADASALAIRDARAEGFERVAVLKVRLK